MYTVYILYVYNVCVYNIHTPKTTPALKTQV